MQHILLFIVLAFGISTIANLLLKKFNLSLIIGYIFTGVFLGYGFDFKQLAHSEALEYLGEFGVVFLMFSIGLEISLEKMYKLKKIIFINGFLQVGTTTAMLFLFAHYFFHINMQTAFIIALAFALSSTAVVLTFLKNSKEIYTPYGQRAMGILIFQDLAVIPILILLGVLVDESTQSLSAIVLHTLSSAFIVLFLLFFVGKYIIGWLLHFCASAKTDELFMSAVLFVVIAASYFAHLMGFTYSLGAFVAGMVIAETKYFHKVEADIAPFKDILLGTFFVLIGLKIDLAVLFENFWIISGLFFALLVFKALLGFIVLSLNTTRQIAIETALSVSQVGEFALVIFSIALSTGLMEEELAKIVILVVIISMVVSPFLVPHTQKIAQFFVKQSNYIKEVEDIGERKNHIIICGYGKVGKFVEEHLEMYGYEYIIVDNNPKLVQNALDNNLEAYLGDMSKTAIVEALHVQDSSAVIITIDNILTKELVAQKVLQNNPDSNLIVQISSKAEREKLKNLNILNAVDGEVEIARILVERVMQCQLKRL